MNDEIQIYIDENYAKLETYIDNIISNNVICGKYEKLAVERFIRHKEKYVYDEAQVKRVIKFFYLLHIKNGNKYERFNFFGFQVFWIANIYGLYTVDSFRLFKKAFITIGKKSGKTAFNACLALYECIYDKELNAHVILLASSANQANFAFEIVKDIVLNSPDLPPLKIQRSTITYQYQNTTCKIEVKSADSSRIQGGNYSFSLIDEYAFHKNDELANRAFTAAGNRNNPLQVLITTAGYDKAKSPAFELQASCENILNSIQEDDSIYVAIYTLESQEEIHDETMWCKALPALGTTPKLENIRTFYNQQLTMPSFRTAFLTDNMNVWCNTKVTWITDDIIKAQMRDDMRIPEGAEVYLGYDGSATKDLSAIFVLYYDKDKDIFIGEAYSLFPNSVENVARKGGINLTTWINDNYIIQTEENAILDGDVLQVLRKIKEKYRIISLGVDPWMVDRMKITIENELEILVNKIPQRIQYLSEPLKECEKLIVTNKMFFARNPVLRWNFMNAVIKNYDNNIKLSKNGSKDSIDILIAMNVAMHEYLAFNFNYNSVVNDNYLKNDYINEIKEVKY